LFFRTSGAALAKATAPGEIDVRHGHASLSRRRIKPKERASGSERWFCIEKVQGKDDVAEVVLAVLASKR
jgi:hypothetical protein